MRKFTKYMEMSEEELGKEHLRLLREKVVLAFQGKDEETKKLHLYSQVRKDLARVKTAMNVKGRGGPKPNSES